MTQVSERRAEEIISSFGGVRIAVLGDVMLDEFVWGDVTRISPEAPVPVVDIRRESIHLGGAANVLANLVSLGAAATLVGVVGDDSAGLRLQTALNEACANRSASGLVVDVTRPTTIKTRIIAHSQLVVRADRESRLQVNEITAAKIIEAMETALDGADALVISDYDKGAVTPKILGHILPFAREKNIPVLIDPKFRNFASYSPSTVVTPNHHEALKLTNTDEDSDRGLEKAAIRIREMLGCSTVLITMGERGMMLFEEGLDPIFVPAMAQEVYDVTGAGDTVIATLAASVAAGGSMIEAATLANHAAGVVVGKVGTATATPVELLVSIRRNAN